MPNVEMEIGSRPPMNALKFWRDQIPTLAERLPEVMRGKFVQAARSMVDGAETQEKIYTKKLESGLFMQPAAKTYLGSQLFEETKGIANITIEGATSSVRAQLDRWRADAESVPGMDPAVAIELRTMIRAMPEAERHATITRSSDPHLASAILNAAAKGFGLGLSDSAKKRLLDNYNAAHRPGLMSQIAEAETFIAAVEQFRDSVFRALRDALSR